MLMNFSRNEIILKNDTKLIDIILNVKMHLAHLSKEHKMKNAVWIIKNKIKT